MTIANSNSKIMTTKNTTKCANVEFIWIKQEPDFDTFCGPFFEEFVIDKSWSELQIRENAWVFLDNIKCWILCTI